MTIVFDDRCVFCRRCAQWLVDQRAAIPTSVVPSSSIECTRRYGAVEGYGEEFLVIGDTGQVWTGPDAFIVALWCLAGYRTTAMRLSGPVGRQTARALFRRVTNNRHLLGHRSGPDNPEDGRGPCTTGA